MMKALTPNKTYYCAFCDHRHPGEPHSMLHPKAAIKPMFFCKVGTKSVNTGNLQAVIDRHNHRLGGDTSDET